MTLRAVTIAHRRHKRMAFRPSLSLLLLALFLAVLWIAGGASRGDVVGQAVVRGAAWTSLIVVALFGRLPSLKAERPILVFLLLAFALALLQLVPLPASVWQALPGRAMFANAATISGHVQPWRPLSIVPSATSNALASLVVPFVMLVLVAGMREVERRWLPGMLLGLVLASALLALLQISGSGFNNPLINDRPGQISASFANRNHLALFLSFGCVLAPVWAFLDGRQALWRAAAALGMIVMFTLTILATGSRAGLVLGGIALLVAPLLVLRDLRRTMRGSTRRAFLALVTGGAATILIAVLAALAADRAVSIQRVLADEGVQDMRSRALPTVLEMIGAYFPAGSGLGGFDSIFRIHEPTALLKLTYFNHAHNDLLEVVLDGGLPGALLLSAGLVWWATASVRAWRGGADAVLARTGSAILGLTLVASAFDYPARTPMISALIIAAGVWMCRRENLSRMPALRVEGDHL